MEYRIFVRHDNLPFHYSSQCIGEIKLYKEDDALVGEIIDALNDANIRDCTFDFVAMTKNNTCGDCAECGYESQITGKCKLKRNKN